MTITSTKSIVFLFVLLDEQLIMLALGASPISHDKMILWASFKCSSSLEGCSKLVGSVDVGDNVVDTTRKRDRVPIEM